MAKEAMEEGVDYRRAAKMSHKGFCLATLENLTKYWPGGSYIFMKSTPRFLGGRPLMNIGHK